MGVVHLTAVLGDPPDRINPSSIRRVINMEFSFDGGPLGGLGFGIIWLAGVVVLFRLFQQEGLLEYQYFYLPTFAITCRFDYDVNKTPDHGESIYLP